MTSMSTETSSVSEMTNETKLKELSTNFFVKSTDFIDSHLRELQYTCYGVAFVGACFAVRSLRVFGKFTKPSSIPKEYFKKNFDLHGVVRKVDPMTGNLMIEHEPIIKLFSRRRRDLLPVNLSGVHHGSLGYQWLDLTTKNQAVVFTLLRLMPGNEIECIVKSNTGFLKKKCLNLEMVRLGLGQVAPLKKELKHIKPYWEMYRKLLQSESEALRHRNGVWSAMPPSRTLVPSWGGAKDFFKALWKKLAFSNKAAKAMN